MKPEEQQALMHVARNNFVHKAAFWSVSVPNIKAEHADILFKVECGQSSDTFNVVIPMGGKIDQVKGALSRVLGYFALKKMALSMWLWDLPDTIGWQFATANLGIVPDELAVIMALNEGSQPKVNALKDGLRIHSVNSADDVITFGQTVATAFGDHPESQAVERFYRSVAPHFKVDKNYRLYILYDDERPVSTICLTNDGHSNGIFDMATVPDGRGKGYASALFSHILTLINKDQPTILAASPMGHGLYEKHGFQVIGDIAVMNIKAG